MHVGEPYRLNRLDNGQICPTCRERVLDSLPPVLPALAGARIDPPGVSPEVYDDSGDPPAAS